MTLDTDLKQYCQGIKAHQLLVLVVQPLPRLDSHLRPNTLLSGTAERPTLLTQIGNDSTVTFRQERHVNVCNVLCRLVHSCAPASSALSESRDSSEL